jgi:hypothetical protein
MRYPNYKCYRTPDSSVIEYVSHYDEDKLNVKFKGGSVYTFRGVSRNRFTRLCNAESIGRYFAQKIKGQYDSHKRDYALERELNEKLA